MNIEQKMAAQKLIPVISLPNVDAGLKLAELLSEHDFHMMEITFRTPFAARGIMEIKKQFPHMTMLAGTVLTPFQADTALAAGAEAIVSPGAEAALIDYCKKLDTVIMPGVCTPSDIQMAISKEITTLKFFPAELSGGVKALKLLLSVYQDISFMPTGGVTPANLQDYLCVDRVICCGGTWLAPESLLSAADWEEITTRIKKAADVVRDSS